MPITLEELEIRLRKIESAWPGVMLDTDNPLTWKEKDALMGQLAKIEGQLKEQDERITKLEGGNHGKQ